MSLWPRTRSGSAAHASLASAIAIPSAPQAPSRAAATHQCDVDALLLYLHHLIAERRSAASGDGTNATGFGVFFIELRRSDRTQALAGLEPARAALTSICERIAGMLRPGDRFALYGVDEILLLLPEVDNPGRAMLVASRLVQMLQAIPELAATMRLRPAIGCALYPTHGDDIEALIAAADHASRAARTSNEGYRIALRGEHASDTAKLSSDLETALRSNQLEVWSGCSHNSICATGFMTLPRR